MNGNHFDWHDHIITSLLPSQYSSVLCHRSCVIVSILFHCLLFISSLFCLSSPLLPVTFDVFLLRRLCLCFCLVAASCCTLRRVLWNALSWEVSLSDCHTPSPELFMATDLSYRPFSLLSFCAAIALFRLSVMRYLQHGEIVVSSHSTEGWVTLD